MSSRYGAVGVALGLACVAWMATMALLLQGSYDTAMGVVLFHLIGGGGIAVTWVVASRTETPSLVRIITAGWCAKVVGTLARFYVLQVVYGGSGDANRYGDVGAEVATMLRSGQVAWHRPGEEIVGTHFVEYVTGTIFTFTGPTTLGGFMVFSALGFIGVYLIFRAVRIAAPEVDVRLCALLLFFLPTMVFWPSSIGKETLMLLGIGLFTYGSAAILTRRASGFLILGAGVALTGAVRPHITLLLVSALLLATVIVRQSGSGREVPLGKLLKAGLAVGLMVWAMAAAGEFLDVGNLDNANAVNQALDATSEQTAQGGSSFEQVNPVFYPWAVVTVLFRPFPYEVGNVQALITSFEGLFLLGLAVRRRRAIWRGLRSVRSSPLLAFALVYTAVFIYAYTGINNFGILARQRSQVFPFFVMLLSPLIAISRSVPRPADASPVRAAAPVRRGMGMSA